jgi:DNA-binding LacI/PurR family transcriptional regulator
LGYKPNPAARSLVSGKTGLIAVIPSLPKEVRVSFSDFGYFTELIAAATDVAVSRDRALVVAPPLSSDFVWERVPLDGVIVIDPFVGDAGLPVLRERGIPFVTVSADPDHPGDDATVECEARDCTLAVFDHFVERGARRVGYLSVPPMTAFLTSSAEAYDSWCAEHGQEPMTETVDLASWTVTRPAPWCAASSGCSTAPRRRTRSTSLEMGVEVHRAMLGMRLAIPDDVLLATTHDRGRALTANPAITTIEWDYREVGRRAASLLIDLVEGTRSAPLLEVVPGRVVPRASTAR